jgi:hypothetical protein
MNAFRTRKAANLRRVLGTVLFAAIVGLGISWEIMGHWSDLAGWAIIVFGGIALAAWGSISAHGMVVLTPTDEHPTSDPA